MRSVLRSLSRFGRDAKAMTNIEFALVAASLSIAISAALLAVGLGITPAPQTHIAETNADGVDMTMTGSVDKAAKPLAITEKPTGCPELPPVILRR